MSRPKKHLNDKTWIPPEKRMKRYKDFGCVKPKYSVNKVKFTRFRIIVPTKKDKEELESAFEYFHDSSDTDTEFVTVNQLCHQYVHENDGNAIIVDKDLYDEVIKKNCKHFSTFIECGIKICKDCGEQLGITSFRD